MTVLTDEQKSEFVTRGFSRRHFGRLGAMLAAGASLPFYNEPALAQLSAVRDMPPDAVRINANENPLGPCAEAAAAILRNERRESGRGSCMKPSRLSFDFVGHRPRAWASCAMICTIAYGAMWQEGTSHFGSI